MISASKPPAQAQDWQAQWRQALIEPAELLRTLGLPHLAARLSANAQASFPLRVPAVFIARMRHADPDDPLLRQVLPVDQEDRIQPGFSLDAVGDLARASERGVIHKYSGRALLIATGSCAIHCRYCFRRHFPYADEHAAGARWRDTVAHLAARTDINEVILSGGDPWSLATARLAELTDQLRPLPHLRRLRIHTRLPVVLPARVDLALIDWLGQLPWPLVIVIHANHANELDQDVAAAIARLRGTGAILLNQSVLLRGVNDRLDDQIALSERLIELGVMPYYLHQLDRVQGTAHFEVPDREAERLIAALRARVAGFMVPQLVREIAGEASKTPLQRASGGVP